MPVVSLIMDKQEPVANTKGCSPSTQMPNIDEPSREKKFGWDTIDNVHVPCIFRKDNPPNDENAKYTETKIIQDLILFGKYDKEFLKAGTRMVGSHPMTQIEADLFTEIINEHTTYEKHQGRPYTVEDKVVSIEQVKEFVTYLKKATENKKHATNCRPTDINNPDLIQSVQRFTNPPGNILTNSASTTASSISGQNSTLYYHTPHPPSSSKRQKTVPKESMPSTSRPTHNSARASSISQLLNTANVHHHHGQRHVAHVASPIPQDNFQAPSSSSQSNAATSKEQNLNNCEPVLSLHRGPVPTQPTLRLVACHHAVVPSFCMKIQNAEKESYAVPVEYVFMDIFNIPMKYIQEKDAILHAMRVTGMPYFDMTRDYHNCLLEYLDVKQRIGALFTGKLIPVDYIMKHQLVKVAATRALQQYYKSRVV